MRQNQSFINKSFSLFYQNAHSIVSKLDLIKNKLYQLHTKLDILALTETWLNKNIDNGELGLFNYNIFRCDRIFNEKITRGGGSMIAINNEINSKLIMSESNNIEEVFIEFTLAKKKYLLGCVYIPPASKYDAYLTHQQTIENLTLKYPNHELIVIGDFNLPHINWSNSPFKLNQTAYLDPNKQLNSFIMHSIYSQLNFNQYYPNHLQKNYTLDLLFAPDDCSISRLDLNDSLITTDNHHTPQLFKIDVKMD